LQKIGFIRHGQTPWNKERRVQGHMDIPLSDDGVKQAHQLANRIKDEMWDLVYASDLKRAKKTAEIIAKKSNLPLYLDHRLRERHWGEIEGTTREERADIFGDNWRELDLGMEPVEDMVERGRACLHEVIAKHPKENILIVSHGAFIKQLLLTLTKDMNADESLKNCSVTTLETNGENWHLTLHNCVRHMAENV